jgi:hypothetical protein
MLVGIELCDLDAARAVLEKELAQFLTQTQNDLACLAVGHDRFPFVPIFGLYKVKPEFSQFIKPIKTGLDYGIRYRSSPLGSSSALFSSTSRSSPRKEKRPDGQKRGNRPPSLRGNWSNACGSSPSPVYWAQLDEFFTSLT